MNSLSPDNEVNFILIKAKLLQIQTVPNLLKKGLIKYHKNKALYIIFKDLHQKIIFKASHIKNNFTLFPNFFSFLHSIIFRIQKKN